MILGHSAHVRVVNDYADSFRQVNNYINGVSVVDDYEDPHLLVKQIFFRKTV